MRQIDNALCNENFGKFIREERERQGLYQSDLAAKLGITQAYYSHIERGTRTVDFTMALNICLALGLDINEFIKVQMDL